MAQSVGLAILAFMPHPPLAGLYALALRAGFCSRSTTRCGARSSPRWSRPRTSRTRSCSTAPRQRLAHIRAGIGGPAGRDRGLRVVLHDRRRHRTWPSWSASTSMRPAELHRRPPKPRTKGEVREGLRYVMSMPSLWISFVMLAAIGSCRTTSPSPCRFSSTDTLHSTGAVFTILYSVFSLGAVVSALVVAHRGLVRMRHIVSAPSRSASTMLLLASVPGSGGRSGGVPRRHGEHPLPDRDDGDRAGRSQTRDARTGPLAPDRDHRRHGAHRRPCLGLARRRSGRASADLLGGVVCLISAAFGYLATRHYVRGAPAES